MGVLEHTQLRYTLLTSPTAASAAAFQLVQDGGSSRDVRNFGKGIQVKLCFQWLWARAQLCLHPRVSLPDHTHGAGTAGEIIPGRELVPSIH